MCSWFCGTFCCFLVRFRDSYIRSTSISYPSRPRSNEVDHPHFLRSSEGAWELSPASPRTTERGHTITTQPNLRPPMPQVGSLSGQSRDSYVPPVRINVDTEVGDRTGARSGSNSNRGIPDSFIISSNEAVVEDHASDIGLIPHPHDHRVTLSSVSQHPPVLFQQRPHQAQLRLPRQHQVFTAPREADTFPISLRDKSELSGSPQQQNDHPKDTAMELRDPSAVLTSFDTEPTANDFAAISYLIDNKAEASYAENKKTTDGWR